MASRKIRAVAILSLLAFAPPALGENDGQPLINPGAPRPLYDGYLNKADADMERMKRNGYQDLRWNHSCPYTYPVRREGAACTAPGVDAGGGMVGNACCTKMTEEETRAEGCRNNLTKLVEDARTRRTSQVGRDRIAIRYNLMKDDCAAELNDIAAQTGRSLPVRGAHATTRSNSLIADSLRRTPGSERRPDYVDSGGTDDTAEYVFEILSFALGAASLVASAYQPRIGGRYGYRDPGRAPPPSARTVPSGNSPRHSSDITGLGR